MSPPWLAAPAGLFLGDWIPCGVEHSHAGDLMSESVELVCPHCQAINRVPAARLGDAPQCGQCHQPVLPPHPVELTQPSFERFITRNQLPVLVDFWAPWCGPCKMFAPVFAQMAGTYAVVCALPRSIPRWSRALPPLTRSAASPLWLCSSRARKWTGCPAHCRRPSYRPGWRVTDFDPRGQYWSPSPR